MGKRRKLEPIIPRATRHTIAAAIACDRIVPRATKQGIVPGPCRNRIVLRGARHRIVFHSCKEHIVQIDRTPRTDLADNTSPPKPESINVIPVPVSPAE